MTRLWQKGYQLHELVARYEAAQNSELDTRLVRHDVWGTLAHIAMLAKIGALTREEHAVLQDTLREILEIEAAGAFTISVDDEDIHTAVENYLVAKAGPAGKKIHLARSRNDQVLVDLRLYGKEQLHAVAEKLCALCSTLLDFASAHENIPMPGYTHMQRAMLSSVGLWASSFAEALLDDEQLLATAYTLNDQSPLGSAAGYGVPVPIDRAYSAQLMGFSKVERNVIYAQNSRGKIEAAIVQALSQIMLDLSKLAQDILLFTTVEYGFFIVPQEICTGSSIMPQKRNLGVMELVRARAQTMLALQQHILGIITGLPSGYNMDYQETKRPFMEALDLAQESLDICALVVRSLDVNKERLLAACTYELFAADRAYELTSTANLPFRDAYRIVAAEVTAQLERGLPFPAESQQQLEQRLQARSHIGGAGNLELDALAQQLSTIKQTWEEKQAQFSAAIEALVGTTSTAREG